MPNFKILIVDDEPFNVDYLEQELEESDYDTLSAVNGQEALDKVQTEAPDLVLLDIMMPIMDGFEVLKQLKADPATREIPVIIISANNDLKSVVKGIQLGAEDYMPKPFESTILHARISSGLEKKRLSDLQKLYIKSLEREMEIAREIQSSFLPSELPKVDGWEIGVYFESAKVVAGDLFDSFKLPDGNLVCIIGDVCDKGIGAALFMTLFRSLIRAITIRSHIENKTRPEPAPMSEQLLDAISFTNQYVAETHTAANMFATLFMGIINVQDGNLSYINCGNEPAILIRQGKVIANLPPSGPAIGIIPDAVFKVNEIIIESSDLLAIFSDGIIDTLNSENEPFGYKRLLKLLKNNERSPTFLVQQIKENIEQFIGSTEQFDDISLMIVKKV